MSRRVASQALAAVPELCSYDLLIYDGECRFCQAQVVRLQRWAGPQLLPLPLQKSGLLDALGLAHEDAMRAMQLVTQQGWIYAGVEAVVQGLRQRPILGRLLRLYYVPGVRQLADLGYRLIARYRYRLMGRAIARGECDGGSCSLHLSPK
jgi:predicted DCC family thiol-disulfide oxidoreductase YuxK